MDELLIEAVRKRPFLYDVTQKNYRDVKVRQEAWDEIANELNISAEKAKDNWERLRRCLANALKRRRELNNGLLTKISPWKYQSQMSFLMPFLGNKKTQIHFNDSSFAEDALTQENYLEQNDSLVPDEDKISFPLLERTDESPPTPAQERNFESKEKFNECAKDIRQERKIQDLGKSETCEIKKLMEQTANLRQMKYENRNNRMKAAYHAFEKFDETDLFFLSMSKMTKKLSRTEQTHIKLNLSNSVLQAELRDQQARENNIVPDVYRPSSSASL